MMRKIMDTLETITLIGAILLLVLVLRYFYVNGYMDSTIEFQDTTTASEYVIQETIKESEEFVDSMLTYLSSEQYVEDCKAYEELERVWEQEMKEAWGLN